MVATSVPSKTLAEYLAEQPDGEHIYELDNGKWTVKPLESNRNHQIEMFLLFHFAQLGISPRYLRVKMEMVVSGAQMAVWVPDLMVLSEGAAIALENATRATIMLHMPAPELVVEVVSPGQKSIKRDYRQKRSQYQARGIEEYWIVDPLTEQVTILSLHEWLYDEAFLSGSDSLTSPWLQRYQADGKLTVTQVLQKI